MISFLYNRSKNFKNTEKKLRGFSEIVNNVKFRRDLAQFTKDIVYKRVKAGYGALNNKYRLPPLSRDYVKKRKLMRLGEGATPGKSNLTATNQMLGAMEISTKGHGFSVYIAATKRRGSSLTNARLASYIQETRPFLHLTDSERRIVKSRMKQEIRKRLLQSLR